jgi:hypothetical protein
VRRLRIVHNSGQIAFRLPVEEKVAIEDAARQLYMGVSEFLRLAAARQVAEAGKPPSRRSRAR